MNPRHLPEHFDDFRIFLCRVWKHLNLPKPTLVQLDLAAYLQHGPRRKVIMAFRGVGKSWITSTYVVWRLALNPQLNFMVVSASKERSDQFSTFTMRLIKELPELRFLTPGSDQRDSKIAFDVGPAEPDHSPSVKSVGIFGQLTGGRADEIIADDVEVPGNSMTQGMRDKLSTAVKEFDAILKPGGRVTFLGTPQCELSLYNQLPPRGYTIRIWPARFPSHEQALAYGDGLAPYIAERLEKGRVKAGMPTDPARFNDLDLMEREASYGRTGFALQFMLDTRLSDELRYPLKLSDLIVMNLNHDEAPEKVIWASSPELVHNDLPCVGLQGDKYFRPMWISKDWLPYSGSVMYIDPSGRGADETSYAVVKMLNGFLYVVEAGGLIGGYTPETLTALANIAKRQKVNLVLVESNFGDGMFNQLLMPYLSKAHPCGLEEVRSTTQKEKRIIDTLEPVMNQHRLVFDRKVIETDYHSVKHFPLEKQHQYMLFYQMTRITRDRGSLGHDDRLEAVAGAVAYWVEQMAQDVDTQAADRRDAILEAELETFMDNSLGEVRVLQALGGKPFDPKTIHRNGGSWINR